MINFRNLEADDIEVRVQQVTDKGCSLLLYKTARCDMRILDETVGQENWDCEYTSVNGYLFCTVGILCEQANGNVTWVYKSDTGTQSNMEPEKGHASDAFKRACTRWGIGRELYTAPFIWVPSESLQKHHERNGRWQCWDKFHVKSVEIKDGSITDLSIANQFDLIVYQMHHKAPNTPKGNDHTVEDKTAPQRASEGRYERIRGLKAEAISLGISVEGIDKWIDSTFKGKPKKDLSDNEIKMAEAYLIGIIKDKRNGQ